MNAQLRVDGSTTLYRLYDIGYAIDLDRASAAFGEGNRGRVRPERQEARAIHIRNPPLFVALGALPIAVGSERHNATLSAHLFDFGVCSLQLRIPIAPDASPASLAAFAAALDAAADPSVLLDREIRALADRIAPAVERAAIAPLSEEYRVFRITRVSRGEDEAGALPPTSELFTEEELVAMLVGERRRLSHTARRELIPYRFSYYEDDLTVLTWESALVVEPRAEDRDVEYVLEFANAQLLELRVYDLELDAELPGLYDRVETTRRRWRPVLAAGRLRRLLSELQTRVADVTETVERVENALKVTNDVYLARIYAAALTLFREDAWRRGIERKLRILRETYAMLNTESQATRAELLELAIVILIVAELVLAFLRG